MPRKIRMGMLGGGPGAFIGEVHRMAAALDGQIELVGGAFSRDYEKSKQIGQELFLKPQRVYANYVEMIQAEKSLSPEQRMDFMAIVTPNHLHYEPAKLALENGFHVVCDKPLAFNLEQARDLLRLVKEKDLLFALTHTYTGYPMVKEARHLVSSGQIGEIRRIQVEYPQGWLSTPLESSGQKQADWRTDPQRSGKSGCMGDIGTHAENLAEYISGLSIQELCADLSTFVPGRRLDDDGNVLIRFDNGAKGILTASQIASGEENNLKIYIYGTEAGLEWRQMEPNTLWIRWREKGLELRRAGTDQLSEIAQAHTRIPAGHPEGYLEAFANIYRNFAKCVQARLDGHAPLEVYQDFPSVEEGLKGMLFIETLIKSNESTEKWTKMES